MGGGSGVIAVGTRMDTKLFQSSSYPVEGTRSKGGPGRRPGTSMLCRQAVWHVQKIEEDMPIAIKIILCTLYDLAPNLMTVAVVILPQVPQFHISCHNQDTHMNRLSNTQIVITSCQLYLSPQSIPILSQAPLGTWSDTQRCSCGQWDDAIGCSDSISLHQFPSKGSLHEVEDL